MIERKTTRRKGGPINPIDDRRRASFERRGTTPGAQPPTREQELYGERRRQGR